MRPLTRTGLRGLTVVLLYTLCIACGGGGGGGSVPAPKCLDFVPATSQTLSMSKGTGSTCDSLVVDINVANPSDLFAVSFTVTYPTAVADFQTRSDAGSILSADGTTLLAQADDQAGSYTLALTRSGTSTGVTMSGTQKVTSLVFRRIASTDTSGAISFGTPKLFDSNTPPGESTPNASGGTLMVD